MVEFGRGRPRAASDAWHERRPSEAQDRAHRDRAPGGDEPRRRACRRDVLDGRQLDGNGGVGHGLAGALVMRCEFRLSWLGVGLGTAALGYRSLWSRRCLRRAAARGRIDRGVGTTSAERGARGQGLGKRHEERTHDEDGFRDPVGSRTVSHLRRAWNRILARLTIKAPDPRHTLFGGYEFRHEPGRDSRVRDVFGQPSDRLSHVAEGTGAGE